ncbi:MAG: hypothetical protein K2P81_01125 [Bacteriovoracaceae bacterium]|nr:hypothetical protein [Bacteriovoracaceae bacterium]
MKTWPLKTSILISALALLGACQEKIAPELSNPSAATGPTTTTTSSTTNDFWLELGNANNLPPEYLGYSLHKANEISTEKCKVSSVVDVPSSLDSTRDISCFLEAEEFALFYNGFTVNAKTDPKTCEYIRTKPFSYWKFLPGISLRQNGQKRQVAYFKCSDEIIASPALLALVVPSYSGTATKLASELCNKYVNIDDNGGTTSTLPLAFGSLDLNPASVPVDVDSASKLCSFNYTLADNSTVNCDEGKMDVHQINVTAIDTNADSVSDTLVATGSSPTVTSCGGRVRNCLSGPSLELTAAASSQSAALEGPMGYINQFVKNEEGTSEMVVESKYPDHNSNIYQANFMRQCSGVANFDTRANFSTDKTFVPEVMYDYSFLGSTVPVLQEKDETYGQLDVVILADNPFRAGLPSSVISSLAYNNTLRKFSVNFMRAEPFYTFECLDKSYDLKARIRLAVREWNRNFSAATQDMQFVSDVYNTAGSFTTRAKMDAGAPVTSNEYLGLTPVTDSSFNDIFDWDEYIVFTNSATGVCDATNDSNPVFATPRTNAAFPQEGE